MGPLKTKMNLFLPVSPPFTLLLPRCTTNADWVHRKLNVTFPPYSVYILQIALVKVEARSFYPLRLPEKSQQFSIFEANSTLDMVWFTNSWYFGCGHLSSQKVTHKTAPFESLHLFTVNSLSCDSSILKSWRSIIHCTSPHQFIPLFPALSWCAYFSFITIVTVFKPSGDYNSKLL